MYICVLPALFCTGFYAIGLGVAGLVFPLVNAICFMRSSARPGLCMTDIKCDYADNIFLF